MKVLINFILTFRVGVGWSRRFSTKKDGKTIQPHFIVSLGLLCLCLSTQGPPVVYFPAYRCLCIVEMLNNAFTAQAIWGPEDSSSHRVGSDHHIVIPAGRKAVILKRWRTCVSKHKHRPTHSAASGLLYITHSTATVSPPTGLLSLCFHSSIYGLTRMQEQSHGLYSPPKK